MALEIVILAAGKGKRMLSKTPKVLHELAGKSMIRRVVETALALQPKQIHIIIGPNGDEVRQSLKDLSVNWVVQNEALGTGHAVQKALPHIESGNQVLILSADVPLIQLITLKNLVALSHPSSQQTVDLAILVAKVDNPYGLGRIVRDGASRVLQIVEEKDTNDLQKKINEIYTGICVAQVSALSRWLPNLNNNNAQGEYYLTEIIAKAVAENSIIPTLTAKSELEVLGVNTRLQLQQLERAYQQRLAEKLLLEGVTIMDAARIDIRGELNCQQDVTIDINAIFEGTVSIGHNSYIGPNCLLKNVTIEDNCHIEANSVLEDCHIGSNCQIGPFARIRPGTKLAANCKIGNFVETKKAVFGEGSKASHLSYLGDVTIGKQVNIGAGTITCNYDGVNKHQTIIEDGAFIGSDTQLVAPVTVGKDATIGAGSTIRKNAPDNALTLTESRQKTIEGWRRPSKKEV